VTGYDLVEQQIRVAFNERLPFKQKDIALRGHSIEARIYAEDPDNHFFPAPGKLSRVRWPSGPFVRVDSGVESGSEVSIFYDPLLAKISVYGETREEACIRLSQALAEVDVCGTKTNTPFLSAIASHPRFKAGELSTAFIREEGPFALAPLSFEEEAAALAAAALSMKPRSPDKPLSVISPWWISGRPGPLFGRSQ
jgi:acetyl/propionyl-CoA carboxylase alpha subunit